MSSGIFIPSIRTVSPLLNSDGRAWSVFFVLKRSNASMIKSARDSTNSSMKDNEICGDAETLTVPSALTRRFTFFTCFRVRVYVILKPAGVLTARCKVLVDVLLGMVFGDVRASRILPSVTARTVAKLTHCPRKRGDFRVTRCSASQTVHRNLLLGQRVH